MNFFQVSDVLIVYQHFYDLPLLFNTSRDHRPTPACDPLTALPVTITPVIVIQIPTRGIVLYVLWEIAVRYPSNEHLSMQ